MIAAHMDEIGFMITHITDNGMIQFTNLGGVANDIWQGQRLKVKNRKNEEIIGVVANIPKHFRTGNEAAPQIKDLMLDIGASSVKKLDKKVLKLATQLYLLRHLLSYQNIDIVQKRGIIDMVVSLLLKY